MDFRDHLFLIICMLRERKCRVHLKNAYSSVNNIVTNKNVIIKLYLIKDRMPSAGFILMHVTIGVVILKHIITVIICLTYILMYFLSGTCRPFLKRKYGFHPKIIITKLINTPVNIPCKPK